jgi:DNA primase
MNDQASWVDYKAVKHAVTITMVLERFGVSLRKGSKQNELAGACPFHQQPGDKSRPFTANTEKNNFHCFNASCGVKGNQVDLVAKFERCTFHEAALKLKEWYASEYAAALATLGIAEPPPKPTERQSITTEQGSGATENIQAVHRTLVLTIDDSGAAMERAQQLLGAHSWIVSAAVVQTIARD